MFALRRKLVIVVKFEKLDMEGIVYLHCRGKLELICVGSYCCQDFEWSDFLVVQLLAWSRGSYISWQQPDHIS